MRTAARFAAHRRGFALLAVLAVMIAATALGLALSMSTGEALDAARNRIALARAAWLAEGCIERARAAIGDALMNERRAAAAWNRIDAVVVASPFTVGCDVGVEPAGVRLNANTASSTELRALLTAAGMPAKRVDSLVDALIDWRDEDAEKRPEGAERDWYVWEGRFPPRNGKFASLNELALVRGLETQEGPAAMLGVESDRVWPERAPLALLAILPGITPEAIARIAEHRAMGAPLGSFAALADMLTPAAKDALLAGYAELVARTTPVPEAWTITARAVAGSERGIATLEVRLVRAGARAAIVRRRSWP